MEFLTLKVDGQDVQVAKGQTVLDAIEKRGVYVPALCHHPDLQHACPRSNGCGNAYT
jgi:NADH dehydrogenase/NADH:ubiquinone oxidoreductase subunit G